MLKRCYNKNSRTYHLYGGRGIDVCDEWRASFLNFLRDMGKRSGPKHSLERVKNNLGYSPDNCIWATKAAQTRNTRRNNLVTHLGVTRCLTDWAKGIGISANALKERIEKWGVEKALITPRPSGGK
jgi:hypothetical protein